MLVPQNRGQVPVTSQSGRGSAAFPRVRTIGQLTGLVSSDVTALTGALFSSPCSGQAPTLSCGPRAEKSSVRGRAPRHQRLVAWQRRQEEVDRLNDPKRASRPSRGTECFLSDSREAGLSRGHLPDPTPKSSPSALSKQPPQAPHGPTRPPALLSLLYIRFDDAGRSNRPSSASSCANGKLVACFGLSRAEAKPVTASDEVGKPPEPMPGCASRSRLNLGEDAGRGRRTSTADRALQGSVPMRTLLSALLNGCCVRRVLPTSLLLPRFAPRALSWTALDRVPR